MGEILAAAVVFGFTLGVSQELTRDLRRMVRRWMRSHRMVRPIGNYGSRFNEGPTARSNNGPGGPTVPKPDIVPKPQFPQCRIIAADGRLIGYVPIGDGRTPNPPPKEP